MATGKLRVRDWDNGERTGTSVELEAESLGHDLSWGSAVFTRTVMVRETESEESQDSGAEDLNEELSNLSSPELVGAKKR